jgi:isopenicillin N synthase-like dioxygenase
MTQDSQLDIPVIDISALVAGNKDRNGVAGRIGQACRDWGFFYMVGHGVDEQLQWRLEEVSRQFLRKTLRQSSQLKCRLAAKLGAVTSPSAAS